MSRTRSSLLCCATVLLLVVSGICGEAVAAHPKMLRLIEAHEFSDAIERIERRVQRGKEANQQGEDGLTALHMAARVGSIEIIELLLENGANVNGQDDLDRTPLALAANNRQLTAARLLLARGASVALSNASGTTPLMLAVRNNDYLLSGLLLEAGANVSAVDNFGTDALMYAATVPAIQDSISQMLLEYGAPATTIDSQGLSAMYIARSMGNRALMDALIKRGGSLESAETAFESRQLKHDNIYFGVQLEEPDGRCEDPRFDIRSRHSVDNRLAPPAWRDAEDCFQAYLEEETECDLEYACVSRDADHAQIVKARRYPEFEADEVPDELNENYAVVYLDPENVYLQMAFHSDPVQRGRSARIAPGARQLTIGFGATVMPGGHLSEVQYNLARVNAMTASYLSVVGDPGGSLLTLPFLYDEMASYSSVIWFRHGVRFAPEPGGVYKVFSDIRSDPISGKSVFDIRIVDFDTTAVVFESRGNDVRQSPE